jgi:quercetin dioxygenase-like cupin family protein
MKFNRIHVIAGTVGLVGVAALAPVALGSPPSGFTPTPLVVANLDRTVDVNSDGVKFKTNRPTDVSVQKVVFDARGSSGWHHHPGIVIVAVQSGRVAVWDENCNKTRYGIGLRNGSVFIESGDQPGKVTSWRGATSYATFIAPSADPPVFRIEDDPPKCDDDN